ncbi:hypothetical protein TNCT_488791 [Trichonephila clavata]|uniref:Uncharacterized protein n=1 Tax=Trichonephila clavata TaxID=2740835 RepID=A0A8X6I0R2_TRICU|nr:hypothetical protein TNCT_488791 [Trichonephila clavata]
MITANQENILMNKYKIGTKRERFQFKRNLFEVQFLRLLLRRFKVRTVAKSLLLLKKMIPANQENYLKKRKDKFSVREGPFPKKLLHVLLRRFQVLSVAEEDMYLTSRQSSEA